jgi:hypothetical protein
MWSSGLGIPAAGAPSVEVVGTPPAPVGGGTLASLLVASVPARSVVAARLAALRADHPRFAGISVWVMGREASGFWPPIARMLR